jgi:glycine cleavage system aminomethyltransferase T
MRQFEVHMPETTAKRLWDRLNADGLRDCGSSMVIVEYDDLSRAEDGLRLAQSDAEHPGEIYPVRGM